MNPTTLHVSEQVLNELFALPDHEKADLADRLLRSTIAHQRSHESAVLSLMDEIRRALPIGYDPVEELKADRNR